ncbi:MAG: exodeoxyribonuclease VII large subunit, partial [Kiritimatiellae bacterium]|nr:exodeoxyribonuclease VII large subunit [Kiritimatiellia bacterium]
MAAQYPEFTVSSLTSALKRTIEGGFSRIVVEGEVADWRRYPSGHCYFTLKDAGAQLSAVMFAGPYEASCRRRADLREGLRDGAKVKAFGTVTVYPPRGNYQLNVAAVMLAGVGELMERFLALKARLGAEGLFDPARKRPLPAFPRRIGLVTSEAGAVVHDMCRVLTRRFPNLEIRLYPALVQGADAPRTIIAGLDYFNTRRDLFAADLVIVARGGGSFEDLFCFNDESLVRAVAASGVPVISAVGHETDYTLCDFAADVRAGTPSIAAELAVPVMADVRAQIDAAAARLAAALRAKYEWYAQRTDHLASALAPALRHKAADVSHRIDLLSRALDSSLKLLLSRREGAFERLAAKLPLLSPYSVLERGYSITTDEQGAVVKSAEALSPGDRLHTRFARGEVTSTVVAPTPKIADPGGSEGNTPVGLGCLPPGGLG